MKNNRNIIEIIDMLITAPRMGNLNSNDVPEGSMYIQLSDTLVKKLINKLSECLE